MITALFTTLLAPLLALASFVARPVTAVCPRGWIAQGVRPSGISSCVQEAPPDTLDTCCRGPGCRCLGYQGPLLQLPVRIFCESPLVPLVRDDRRIACGREPGSHSGQYSASGEVP